MLVWRERAQWPLQQYLPQAAAAIFLSSAATSLFHLSLRSSSPVGGPSYIRSTPAR